MDREIKPHPLNNTDGFYVEDGCCTACDIPNSEAPELFDYDEEFHCYVTRQPKNEEEIDKAIGISQMAELECIRYGGSDSEVIRRMAELGNPHLCDSKSAKSIKPVFRNHVTFNCLEQTVQTPNKLANKFKKFLM